MNFDAIVLGTGGVGSAAMFHLARRGVRVLGLDRFPPGHDRGSSHGESRLIRRSYFEHADYVPLLKSAWSLWDELAQLCDRPLLHRTGVLYFASPEGAVVKGILKSAQQHQLDVEQISLKSAVDRFPGFVAPENTIALFEADAGYLTVEQCVTAHIQQAVRLGAKHRHGETILNWSAGKQGVRVETDRGRYDADRLVITAGSWTNDLLADLHIPLRILRKHVHWYAVSDGRYRQAGGCPCFFFEALGGYFYGCPANGSTGLKVAEHSGGTEITDPLTDPLTDPRTPEDADTHRVESFLSQHLPGVAANRIRHQHCFYTMTPDEHFIIDQHPEHDSVVFAAGLSGHGFKFTAALGKTLAELVLAEEPAVSADFLKLSGRFSMTPRSNLEKTEQ